MKKSISFALLGLTCLSGAAPATAAAPQRCAGAVYVANSGPETLTVIDTSTDKVVATIKVGKRPTQPVVTRDGRRVYVTNDGEDSLTEIDGGTNRILRTIKLPEGQGGSGLAVSPDGKWAVTSHMGSPGVVTIINLATGKASAPITVGINSERVAITPDGKRAYVTDGAPKMPNGTVSVIDMASARKIATIAVEQYPFNLLVSPDGKRVYIANVFSTSVSVIDTGTNMVVNRIKTAGSPNGMAFSRDGKRIWITNFAAGTIQSIDIAKGVASGLTPTTKNPSFLGITPDGAQGYFVHPMSDTVSVIDMATLGVANIITTGKTPSTLAVCPYPGARRTVAAARAPVPLGARIMTTENTDIGPLLDNPVTRAIVDKHIPGFSTGDQVKVQRNMSFRMLQTVNRAVVTNEQMAAIDADLAKLPPR